MPSASDNCQAPGATEPAPSASKGVSETVARITRDRITKLISVPEESLSILPRTRNPSRRDFGTRFEYTVSADGAGAVILVLAPSLENLAERIRPFQEKHPDITIPTLAHGRLDDLDFIVFPKIEGESLQSRLASHPNEAESLAGRTRDLAEQLSSAAEPVSVETVASEIDDLLARALRLRTWTDADCELLETVAFPLLRRDALANTHHRRWSNGDFTASNIIIRGDGSLRLIDYEFAFQTCLAFDDAWRFDNHSNVPGFFAQHLKSAQSSTRPAWADVLSNLRYLLDLEAVIQTVCLVTDTPPALSKILAYCSDSDPSVHSNPRFRRVAERKPLFPELPFCELSHPRIDSHGPITSTRSAFVPGQENTLRFLVSKKPGPLAFHFHPTNRPGSVSILKLIFEEPSGTGCLTAWEGAIAEQHLQITEGLSGPLPGSPATYRVTGERPTFVAHTPNVLDGLESFVLSITFKTDETVSVGARLSGLFRGITGG